MDANATVKIDPAKKKAKILLVEDEANIASMVEDWLSEKYDVVIASTGKQALEKALSEKPDIILEDINLPDMVGFDVVKILEKDSKTNQIPVIFLTGEKMVEDTVKFISTVKNVKGYVNKPFRLKDFLEKIDAILSHRSEFVVLERRPATAESTGKMEAVREARVESAKAADAEEKRPAIAVPNAKAAKAAAPVSSGRGALGKLLFGLFRLAFLLVFWVALVLAGVELSCRYAETFAGRWMFLPPFAAPAAGAPVTLTPGAMWEQNGILYRLNAQGLRDDDVAEVRSTDTFRTVLLAGTPLFGRDMSLGETAPKKLMTLLSASPLFASSVTYQVVNASLWGLSPSDQWTAYQGLHGKLQPDLVVWVVGDSSVRRPLSDRLAKAAAWPLWVNRCLEYSRAAEMAATYFLYEGPVLPDAGGLSEKVLQFVDQNPGVKLMVVKVGGLKGLEGLTPRPNLMIYGIGKSLDPDTTWKGVSARGHAALAKTLHGLLLKNKDRLRTPA